METGIVKIEPTQLDEVVKRSGLKVDETNEIKKSYLPFLSQLSEIQIQSSKINYDDPEKKDEMLARELRLNTVKIRTGAEKLKDERKRMYLLRGNLEQASYNLIATSCKLTEEIFFNVEKQREIAEKKRIENLRLERLSKLQKYTDIEPVGLGEMAQDIWENYLLGQKTAYEIRIEAEKKAETERLEKERKEELHQKRTNSIRHLWQFMDDKQSNQHLGELSDNDWNVLVEILDKKKEDYDKEQERIRKENERLANEAKKKQKELEAEREKARKEQEKKDAQLKTEREKSEKLQKEKEEKERKDREEKEKMETEERKAKMAPDKNKLLVLANQLDSTELPELKTSEANEILENIKTLIAKTTAYIRSKADEL